MTLTRNKNLLSVNKFKLVIHKYPNLGLFAQRITLPGIMLGTVMEFTNTDFDVWVPGDKITFDDLIISTLIDEDLTAYQELKEWLRRVAISENKKDQYSDMDLVLNTNNSNPHIIAKFYNTFPYSVSSILMDTTESEDNVLNLDVTFKLTHFDIMPIKNT